MEADVMKKNLAKILRKQESILEELRRASASECANVKRVVIMNQRTFKILFDWINIWGVEKFFELALGSLRFVRIELKKAKRAPIRWFSRLCSSNSGIKGGVRTNLPWIRMSDPLFNQSLQFMVTVNTLVLCIHVLWKIKETNRRFVNMLLCFPT